MWLRLFQKPVNKLTAVKAAVSSAVIQAAYVGLVVKFMNDFGNWVENDQGLIIPEFIAGFLMLTLFVISVAVSGLVVFGYPIFLILEHKRYRLAIATTLLTLALLLVIIMVVIGIYWANLI